MDKSGKAEKAKTHFLMSYQVLLNSQNNFYLRRKVMADWH